MNQENTRTRYVLRRRIMSPVSWIEPLIFGAHQLILLCRDATQSYETYVPWHNPCSNRFLPRSAVMLCGRHGIVRCVEGPPLLFRCRGRFLGVRVSADPVAKLTRCSPQSALPSVLLVTQHTHTHTLSCFVCVLRTVSLSLPQQVRYEIIPSAPL